MYKILQKQHLAPDTYLMKIYAPLVAKSAKPGQFVIIVADERAERIPLTIADYDLEDGSVTVVIQGIGESTKELCLYEEGQSFHDFVGPLGRASELIDESLDELQKKKILFIAGGLGAAPVYPQVKWLFEHGVKADVIIGARNKDLIIYEKEMIKVVGGLYITTDDGSYVRKGMVTEELKRLYKDKGKKYDLCVIIGPMIMMKFTAMLTKELGIPSIVSMNPIMVDGTGMCGACRVSVGGKVKFACVDGPEFDAHEVNFDEALRRQRLSKTAQGRVKLKQEDRLIASPHQQEHESCIDKAFTFDKKKKTPDIVQPPVRRITNFDEVSLGYTLEMAQAEATRCLMCKKPKCVPNCPVSIQIPDFIQAVADGDMYKAYDILSQDTCLPAVCGRVCPQEDQCEGYCIVGIKNEPVAIGRLERFVADWARENGVKAEVEISKKGKKVAVIGSGPAGIACANDLIKLGYEVVIFEALHEPGGVLVYGIPEFRLPKEIVDYEISNLKELGVKIQTNVIVGRTITISELLEDEKFDAVFIGSGAGLPKFMGIAGENANGVFSANEVLTRTNLMKAYDEDHKTPINLGKKVAIIGAGNVAMDAARTAKRLGSDVYVIYRRSKEESPARIEELHHAEEEEIKFHFLTNPVEILSDNDGFVSGIKCVKMELGEPDDSGRRRPKEVEGSEFELDIDTVVMSIGTSPNPLISQTTSGLEVNRWGCIVADDDGVTSKGGVFAGGDAVTGAATVILAMGAGKKSAAAIDKYLNQI